MPYTNEAAVRKVLATSLTSDQVEAFIADTHVWVSEELAGSDLSAARLELIERYLACAMIRLRDLGMKSRSIKDISETYQVDSEVTDYLKRAAAMDPTGIVEEAFMPSGTKVVKFGTGTTFTAERKASDI